jgi:hypothetical protein
MALAGAVVSKPTAKKTTCLAGLELLAISLGQLIVLAQDCLVNGNRV